MKRAQGYVVVYTNLGSKAKQKPTKAVGPFATWADADLYSSRVFPFTNIAYGESAIYRMEPPDPNAGGYREALAKREQRKRRKAKA